MLTKGIWDFWLCCMTGEACLIDQLQSFLLWCTLINFAVLLLWMLAFFVAHDWLYQRQARWFRLSVETFDRLNYLLVGGYKLAILLFNLVPLLALYIAF